MRTGLSGRFFFGSRALIHHLSFIIYHSSLFITHHSQLPVFDFETTRIKIFYINIDKMIFYLL